MSMLNRTEAELIIQALTGGDGPDDGETIIFGLNGWVFGLFQTVLEDILVLEGEEPYIALVSTHVDGIEWRLISGGDVDHPEGDFVLRNETDDLEPFRVTSDALDQLLTLDDTGIIIGEDSSPILGHLTAVENIDVGSIATTAFADLAITVTGAEDGDDCSAVPFGGLDAGLVIAAIWASTDAVNVRLYNPTGSSIDPVARDWRGSVWKH